MIDIVLNGQPHRIDGHLHVRALVEALALAEQNVAVAINRQIVPRTSWAQRTLAANDRVEIVRAIGGG